MVYLIHFRQPYRHARHYLGSTTNLTRRLGQHLAGTGSPLLAAVQAAGIPWSVVRTWPGGRTEERKLKDRHASPGLCPVCRMAARFDGGSRQ